MINNQIFYNVEKNYVSLEEKDLLINFLKKEKQLDFSEYSEASVRRRIAKILTELRISDVNTYIRHLSEESAAMDQFIELFTVNVTEMFRDPFFYQTLINKVFPLLAKKDEIRIWSAGCSTGEEVLSLAILLEEHGLLHKTTILGTDLSERVLEVARKRTYKLRHLEGYRTAYLDSGGKYSLDKYFTIQGEEGTFDDSLYTGITFKKHNVTGEPYTNAFEAVICRNVLIYFNASLQDKVIGMFSRALTKEGFLMLGSKESALFYQDRMQFQEIELESRIYQKVR